MKKNSKFSGFYLGLIFFLMYLPVAVVVIFSLNESKLPVAFTGFSLKWYEELFRDSAMMEALGNGLILGVLSCPCAAVIGTLGAVGLFRINWKTKGALEYVSILPPYDLGNYFGNGSYGIFLHAWPYLRYAHSFDRTYGILCSLYINAGKSTACGNGSVLRRRRVIWGQIPPGILGYYPSSCYAGCCIRLPSCVCHVNG